jgi:hypothetical protein
MIFGINVLLLPFFAALILVALIGNHQFKRERLIEDISKMSFNEVMYKILQPPARGFHPQVRDALLKQGAKEISIFSPPDAVKAFYRYAKLHPITEVVATVERKVPRLVAA